MADGWLDRVGSSYRSRLLKIRSDNCKQAHAGIHAVGAGQADSFSVEFRCQLRDCEMRMQLVATPHRQGAVHGVMLAHTDTTRPRDTQGYKQEAMGRLTGGVAHDFANLVASISGYSEILLNRIGRRIPAWAP